MNHIIHKRKSIENLKDQWETELLYLVDMEKKLNLKDLNIHENLKNISE